MRINLSISPSARVADIRGLLDSFLLTALTQSRKPVFRGPLWRIPIAGGMSAFGGRMAMHSELLVLPQIYLMFSLEKIELLIGEDGGYINPWCRDPWYTQEPFRLSLIDQIDPLRSEEVWTWNFEDTKIRSGKDATEGPARNKSSSGMK